MKLAQKCKAQVEHNWPQHPAFQRNLQSLNEPLNKTLWNYEDSQKLLKAINTVLYKQVRN